MSQTTHDVRLKVRSNMEADRNYEESPVSD
jgi:hypothetical protein